MEINGKHTKLPEGTTILDYLEQNHYVLAQIAVEHNYVILDKEDYAKVVLNAGKREIKKPEKSRKTEKSKKREKQKRGKKDERNNKRYMEIRRA